VGRGVCDLVTAEKNFPHHRHGDLPIGDALPRDFQPCQVFVYTDSDALSRAGAAIPLQTAGKQQDWNFFKARHVAVISRGQKRGNLNRCWLSAPRASRAAGIALIVPAISRAAWSRRGTWDIVAFGAAAA